MYFPAAPSKIHTGNRLVGRVGFNIEDCFAAFLRLGVTLHADKDKKENNQSG
jgi:hypothetical protein